MMFGKIGLLCSAVAFVVASSEVRAQAVGFQYIYYAPLTPPLAPGDSAGVVPTTGWVSNATDANGFGSNTFSLSSTDALGNTSTVAQPTTYQAPYGYYGDYSSTAGNTSPDATLLKAQLTTGGIAKPITLNVTSGYTTTDVYVYGGDYSDTDNESIELTSSDGSIVYSTSNPTLTASTTYSGLVEGVNYVEFAGVTQSIFNVVLTGTNSSPFFSGIELVDASVMPEPSAAWSAAFLFGGACLMRRRRGPAMG